MKILTKGRAVAATGGATALSGSTAAPPVHHGIITKFIYLVEQWLSASALSKALVVGVTFSGFIALGGLLYRTVTKAGFRESLFQSMRLLTNSPGVDASNYHGENPKAAWVNHLLYFQGLIFFSLFVGAS